MASETLTPSTAKHQLESTSQSTTSTSSPPAKRTKLMSSSESSKKTILVTGGCGYIGSHTIVCLLQKGYSIVVVDNLVNSSEISLDRISQIVGLSPQERQERLIFYQVDLCDKEALRTKVFQPHESSPFHACIHFAGLKAVGESTRIPLKYYENNLVGTFNVLDLLHEFKCRKFVFSSSATVYGAATEMPISETATVGLGITNAYGRTKYMIEDILHDFYKSPSGQDGWSMVILRYFNPVGAHPSGMIGEDPSGIPNNLMPYVAQVAVGRREFLTIFGNDYDTPDGTGVRDYIHIMDLAEGHLSSIEYMEKQAQSDEKNDESLYQVFNLGTGHGYSVLDMVRAMGEACGHEIAYKIGPRRSGDIATCYANAEKANTQLCGWKATRNLQEMCKDLWCWQQQNPNGYAKEESSS